MSGNYIWECTNKKCKKRLVYWAEAEHGGVVKEGGSYTHASDNGNIYLCPDCEKPLNRYYKTCTDCGCATCGGMSSCANCYEK